MSEFKFYSYLFIYTFIYWFILYLFFRFLRKDKTYPIYKTIFFWFSSILSTTILYITLAIVFVNSTFGVSDFTDTTIIYDNEIMSGEDDGLMYTNWIKVYDNHTFHMVIHQIESNGYYTITDDTIMLNYSSNSAKEEYLPFFFIIKNCELHGYNKFQDKFDSTLYTYFSLFPCQVCLPNRNVE